jgi:hypothetical protein
MISNTAPVSTVNPRTQADRPGLLVLSGRGLGVT